MMRDNIFILLVCLIGYLTVVKGDCDTCQPGNIVACHSETVFSLCVNGFATQNYITCPENTYCTSDYYVCYTNSNREASCSRKNIDEEQLCGVCNYPEKVFSCIDEQTVALCFGSDTPYYENLYTCPVDTVCDLNNVESFCTERTKAKPSCATSTTTVAPTTSEPTTTSTITTQPTTEPTTPEPTTTTEPVTTTESPTTNEPSTTQEPTTASTITTQPTTEPTTTSEPITTTEPVTTTETPTTHEPSTTQEPTTASTITTQPTTEPTTTSEPITTTEPVTTTETSTTREPTTTQEPTTASTITTQSTTTIVTTEPTTTLPATTTTRRPLTPSEDCQEQKVQKAYKNPDDPTCKTFLFCSEQGGRWITSEGDCSDDQWFDKDVSDCVSTKPDECQETLMIKLTTTTTTPKPPTTVPTNLTTQRTVIPSKDCQESQVPKRYKNPADPTCITFLYCTAQGRRWITIEVECDDGTWFDEAKSNCVSTKPKGCT